MIEAVTVCVQYSDFLRETVIHNSPHFDKWVIVTRPSDEKTRSLCREFSLDCVTTDDFDRDPPFAKSLGIDRGMAHLRGNDWILHIDADIALPVDFDSVIADAHLDPSCIYGCDRLNVVGIEAWRRVVARGLLSRRGVWQVDMDRPDCKVGARVANNRHGWQPIGFFQLLHGSEMNWRSFPSRRYPANHGTAARSDCQFALLFDRRKRVLIPELLVWHLESEKSPMGANWGGRKSKPLGEEPYC